MMENSNDELGTNILLVRSHQVTACKTKRAGEVPSRHQHTYEEPFLVNKRLQKPALPAIIFLFTFLLNF